jgi:hypothetical protein
MIDARPNWPYLVIVIIVSAVALLFVGATLTMQVYRKRSCGQFWR